MALTARIGKGLCQQGGARGGGKSPLTAIRELKSPAVGQISDEGDRDLGDDFCKRSILTGAPTLWNYRLDSGNERFPLFLSSRSNYGKCRYPQWPLENRPLMANSKPASNSAGPLR